MSVTMCDSFLFIDLFPFSFVYMSLLKKIYHLILF
jgi:hypothetical protein